MIMNRKMQYYKIMLTMKSPVHIGSGRTLKKKEYYYDSIRKKVKIIDLEKFAVLINSKGLFESYLEYMSRPGGYDLCEYFKRNKITNSELDSVSAYEIATSDLVFDKKKFDIKTFAVLHFILLLYSFVGVFMKLAFQNEMFSFKFFLFAGLAVLFLGIYAIVWQQVLKKMPLTVAFTNKAIYIVWGMLWGALFLGDQITWYKILGSLIVFPGVVLVVSSNE